MTWRRVTGRILKSGAVYTSEDFRPGPDDITAILSIDPDALIARDGAHIMRFRDGKYVGCEDFFSATEPPYTTPMERMVLRVLLEYPEGVSPRELGRRLYPHLHMRGAAWRLVDKPSVWAPERGALERRYPGEEIEAHDYRLEADRRAGSWIYQRFTQRGWVEQVEHGVWRACVALDGGDPAQDS